MWLVLVSKGNMTGVEFLDRCSEVSIGVKGVLVSLSDIQEIENILIVECEMMNLLRKRKSSKYRCLEISFEPATWRPFPPIAGNAHPSH